jgi:hypothetical protein
MVASIKQRNWYILKNISKGLTSKEQMAQIEIDLSFKVPDLGCKFPMICLRGT